MNVRAALEQITVAVLAEMAAAPGWARHDLCAWDINTGWCDRWAELAADAIGGKIEWVDDAMMEECGHCVLYRQRRYYDSQCLDGVEDYHYLDVVRGISRDAWLSQNMSSDSHRCATH